jgi:hypothetical protein
MITITAIRILGKHIVATAAASFFSVLLLHAQTFTSSNLPVVIINTNGQTIPDEPKIMADMGIVYNGAGSRNTVTDNPNNYNGKIGIEVRGKSSQQFPMKSYSIELWDTAGASVNKSILGMPAESDWVLYAPYTDKTLMHNVLAYTLSNQMGHWAAHCRYVEVVLNNSYIGIYVLMEKIKRGSSRIDISKLKTTDIAGDALTGGYIFKIDKIDAGEEGWFSQIAPPYAQRGQKVQFIYYYPKTTDIAVPQKEYIKTYIDSFELALNSTGFQDTTNGFRKFADINSFIDYSIINELSRNVDGYRLSSYFYKDKKSKGGKIIAGPVWDYDIAFRNANYCNGSSTDGWAYQFNSVCNTDSWLIPFWWERFMQDTAYKSLLRCRWKQLRQTTLSNRQINFLVDSVNSLLGEAQQRHFERWPILGKYVWPNPQPIPATYPDEITTLKQWLTKRMEWIDNNIPNMGVCSDIPVIITGSMGIKIYPNPAGDNVNVLLQLQRPQQITLQISNATGQVVYAKQINAIAGINTFTDLHSQKWAAGVYNFYFINNQGEKVVQQVVKQ